MPTSRPVSRFASCLIRLFHGETGAGLLLILVAAAAMALANSPAAHGYHALFHDRLAWTPMAALGTLHAWINNGLMAVFFFVVGLEIKREVLNGQLSTPALHPRWAIPAATDIAFAVGMLSLLGPRVPASLRLFLLTVAIVDDLGAVLIIAVAYTAQLAPLWLGIAALILAGMTALNRRGKQPG